MKKTMILFCLVFLASIISHGGPVDLANAVAIKARIAQDVDRADANATITNRWAYENSYLSMCDQISGQTNHVKLSFLDLTTALNALQATNPMLAISTSLQLLTLDAALKRFDIKWWDTCTWHPEIVTP